MWAETEVLHRLPRILGSSQQQGVGTSWRPHGQLIQSQALAACSGDPGTCGGCEAERGNGELGDGEEAVVVGDGADKNDGLAGSLFADVLGGGGTDDTADGHGWPVDLGHKQPAEDNSVELGVSAA